MLLKPLQKTVISALAKKDSLSKKTAALTVTRKPSKTVGYSDILRSRAAWNKMKGFRETFPLVRLWFELRTMHTETLQKP